MRDVALLKEALPYLRLHRRRTMVIKLGGEIIETFGYDAVGHRISDGRQDYLWSWRGELVEVELTSGEAGGYNVEYGYDASGRLLERTEYDDTGAFVAKRGFLWNNWELLAQVGLNHADEPIWQVQNLLGPGGLDDSPQLAVTTHIHPSDPGEPVTRYFDLVRDEMGTVLAVLEDVEHLVERRDLALSASHLRSPRATRVGIAVIGIEGLFERLLSLSLLVGPPQLLRPAGK